MRFPELKIGKIRAKFPIIQGGMGLKVSLSGLAAAVSNAGGIGTISSVGIGDVNAKGKQFEIESIEGIKREVKRALELSNDGNIAVNVMGALSNSEDLIKAAVSAGAKMIVYGAGLPRTLPALVEDDSVSLVPIVSSARAATLILKMWDKKNGRRADAVIVEGPLAGGHLGFSPEQLEHKEDFPLEGIVKEVIQAVKPYENKYGQEIPVIAAGGIFNGEDIGKMLSIGASGVQMGSRFVCTEECGVSEEFKQSYISAKEEDIVIIKSPVGLPGRALNNSFLKNIDMNAQCIKCPYHCLSSCKIDKAKFCIAKALYNSYLGNVDNGLIFCGQNAHRIDRIVSVKELMSSLTND